MARTGVIAGVVGALPEEAPELLYGMPLGTYADAVAVRAGETLTPSDPASFAGWRVGVIDGYEYFGPIADYIAANRDDRNIVQHATGARPLKTNLRKLRAGRIDMVTDAEAVLAYALEAWGLNGEVEIITASARNPIYVGFSPAIPEAAFYAEQLDAGVSALRENGRLAEILARYGLSDWTE
jgi:polar amino acid transport system substrate-binding protein